MNLETVRYTKTNGVATITLDRAEKKNALKARVFQEINQCLDDAAANSEIAAVIITGGEAVFSAGMDIAELQALNNPEDIHRWWNYSYNVTLEHIYNFRVPTIAAVSGLALAGGFDLAVSCDFRIVSETARFAQLEVNVHLSPGIERLWRLVGLSRAKYLGLTGDIIDANEAYRIGLADKVVPVADLQKEALALATKFTQKPRRSLEKAKQSYGAVVNMSHQSAIEWETLLLCHLFDTKARRDIMERFLRR